MNAEIFDKVNTSLESIRPYLEADGGNVTLLEITKDMRALVKFHGACCNCAMSSMTLKAGVEGAIKAAVPEIVGVEAVMIS